MVKAVSTHAGSPGSIPGEGRTINWQVVLDHPPPPATRQDRLLEWIYKSVVPCSIAPYGQVKDSKCVGILDVLGR